MLEDQRALLRRERRREREAQLERMRAFEGQLDGVVARLRQAGEEAVRATAEAEEYKVGWVYSVVCCIFGWFCQGLDVIVSIYTNAARAGPGRGAAAAGGAGAGAEAGGGARAAGGAPRGDVNEAFVCGRCLCTFMWVGRWVGGRDVVDLTLHAQTRHECMCM